MTRLLRPWLSAVHPQSSAVNPFSSPPERRVRWTPIQARYAALPVMVRPRLNSTTAAPRPTVAIVPLSVYSNRAGSSSSPLRMFSPASVPRLESYRPELGKGVTGLRIAHDRHVTNDEDVVASRETQIHRGFGSPVIATRGDRLTDQGRAEPAPRQGAPAWQKLARFQVHPVGLGTDHALTEMGSRRTVRLRLWHRFGGSASRGRTAGRARRDGLRPVRRGGSDSQQLKPQVEQPRREHRRLDARRPATHHAKR